MTWAPLEISKLKFSLLLAYISDGNRIQNIDESYTKINSDILDEVRRAGL
jgi:hypothetical protein